MRIYEMIFYILTFHKAVSYESDGIFPLQRYEDDKILIMARIDPAARSYIYVRVEVKIPTTSQVQYQTAKAPYFGLPRTKANTTVVYVAETPDDAPHIVDSFLRNGRWIADPFVDSYLRNGRWIVYLNHMVVELKKSVEEIDGLNHKPINDSRLFMDVRDE